MNARRAAVESPGAARGRHAVQRRSGTGRLKTMVRYKYLYLLGLPGMLFMLVFSYAPMPGIVLAFENFDFVRGITGSPWVGFANFQTLLASPDFWQIFRNSLLISVAGLVFLFPAPIILALLLNELRAQIYKRVLQTIYYLPHFLSWVIVISLTYFLLSTDQGLFNKITVALGGQPSSFMLHDQYFYPIILIQQVWKEIGWSSIIYLAAIAGVNPSLYEAAEVDGAGRLAKMRHVTVPSIVPVIVILFILSLGALLSANFEQIYLMQNPLNLNVSEVIDTFAFKTGVQQGDFSYATAVGLFKSVIAMALVLAVNWLVKKRGQEGVF